MEEHTGVLLLSSRERPNVSVFLTLHPYLIFWVAIC